MRFVPSMNGEVQPRFRTKEMELNTRSAHATIKGYFYQFDHSILTLLRASSPQSSIVVEGIEDIDLESGPESAFVQCKYYEGSSYNHSLIKGSVVQMLRHFHAGDCNADQVFRYRLYGHYKSGQDKLPSTIGLEFAKKHLLTFTHKKKTTEIFQDLCVTDEQLISFLTLLEIDLHAPSYRSQQDSVCRDFIAQIPGATKEDVLAFYYPVAISVIQKLAVKAETDERRITKAQFLSAVNRKDHVFSLWLKIKFGDEYYARLINRKYFRFNLTKVPKASRIFVMDFSREFDLGRAALLLGQIGEKFSHKEHKRSPPQDRFCPYVLVRGLAHSEVVKLKGALLDAGVWLNDGYPFHGSSFSPLELVKPPTKENLTKIKFIPTGENLASVVSAISGTIIEVFDFFKTEPIDGHLRPKEILYHEIKIDSVYFIREVLKI